MGNMKERLVMGILIAHAILELFESNLQDYTGIIKLSTH